jgi:hypothetical protein
MSKIGITTVARIIAERDKLTLDEAIEEVTNCVQEMKIALHDDEGLDALEDIIMDMLGLEPDYIEELIDIF